MPGFEAEGAEARIEGTDYMGLDAVRKVRPPKGYRIRELDSRIRSSRTRSEARVMREARAAGVRTPCVYDVDPVECSIVMERIRGEVVKDHLDRCPGDAPRVCREVGRTVARLHSAGICHGDLTTSNMILCGDGTVCLIDMSMGRTSAELEDIGVDLRLLERAFSSAHAGLPEAFAELMDEYLSKVEDPDAVTRKLEEIRSRGRYT